MLGDTVQIYRSDLHVVPATDNLVLKHLRYAYALAYRYHEQAGKHVGVELSDLIQEANLGLVYAAAHFDASKGSFHTYARWWIRHCILRALPERMRAVRMPFALIARLPQAQRVRQHLWQEQQQEPTAAQIGAKMVPPLEAKQVERLLTFTLQSLETPISSDGSEGNPLTLADLLEAPEADPASLYEISSEKKELLYQLLARLSSEEKIVIVLRYGLISGGEERPSYAHIAAMLREEGIRRDKCTIGKIEQRALLKMRRSAQIAAKRREDAP